MDAGVISSRYAKAIYEFACAKGKEADVHKEMQALCGNFSAFPEMRCVMDDPTVTADDKIRVLTTACDHRPDDTLQQALGLVVRNGRANYMEDIARMYDQVYRKAKGIVIVSLTMAEADASVEKSLLPVIKQVTGGQLEFHTDINPDLIGGFILEIEDKRLDASVKNQLHKIKQNARY